MRRDLHRIPVLVVLGCDGLARALSGLETIGRSYRYRIVL